MTLVAGMSRARRPMAKRWSKTAVVYARHLAARCPAVASVLAPLCVDTERSRLPVADMASAFCLVAAAKAATQDPVLVAELDLFGRYLARGRTSDDLQAVLDAAVLVAV